MLPGMGTLAAVLHIVLQRSMGNRRLLLTVAAGTVIAAALAAAVAIYTDAVRDLGLSYALRTKPPVALDVQVSSSNLPGRRRDYELRRDLTARLMNHYLGDHTRDTIRHGQTATYFLTQPGAPVSADQNRPRAFFQYFERLGEQTRLVEGRRPNAATPVRSGRPEVEVTIGRETAQRLNVPLGATFDMHPYWRPEAQPVRVTVVGYIEPLDQAAEYWMGRTDRFSVTVTSWPTYPFFTDEGTVVDVLAGYLPDMDVSYQTFAFIDIDTINSRNAAQLERNLHALEDALRQDIAQTRVDTKLTDTLEQYREKLFFTRLPLFALMLQVIGVVLYYLVMIATMLVERQAGEIALLKSRGASTLQIMVIYGIEGGVIALLGALLGPLVAAGVITLLGPTPPFRALSDGELLDVTIGFDAYALAIFGGLLALGALLWPAYRATRRSIVHYKSSIGRPGQQPAFIRYYGDLLLLGVGALLFYQLRQRGTLVTERLFGELSADPLLLATPALFSLMIALVFLRLFPLALRLVARLSRGLAGAVVPLGLARMVRAPLDYSRLILLLILACAVGVFAAGFRATLDRSYEDRIAYQAGAQLLVQGARDTAGVSPQRFAETVAGQVNGAQPVPAWRTNGSFTVAPYRYADLQVLAVPADRFAAVAYWRDDFAGKSLSSLLAPLREGVPSPPAGPELPAGATYLGLWIWSAQPHCASAACGVRLVDDEGVPWDFRLDGPPQDQLRNSAWQLWVADLRRPGFGRTPDRRIPRPDARLRFEGLYLRQQGGPAVAERAAVYFDDMQVTTATQLPADWWDAGLPAPVLIEGFETLDRWEMLGGLSAQPSTGSLNRSAVRTHGGEAAAQLAFERRRGLQVTYGFRVREEARPVPVLVSETFLAAAKKRVGDELLFYVDRHYLTVRVAGSFELFPTYTPTKDGQHLVVADLDRLLRSSARVAGQEAGRPNEVWMGAAAGEIPTLDALRGRGVIVDRVLDLEALRLAQQRDPLVAASWQGILFISFAAVLLLTALGFAVYSYLSAQTRTLEFAILRTMGFSGRQIMALVGFEHLFVIVAGAAAGTVLGLPLGRLMLGYMGIDETGAKVLPPFVSEVSWTAVLVADGLLALVFATTIGALIALYRRLPVHRALRMGEL